MKIIDKVLEEETKKLRINILKNHCPSEFSYLGIDDMYATDNNGTCMGIDKHGNAVCDKCWKREYEESEE